MELTLLMTNGIRKVIKDENEFGRFWTYLHEKEASPPPFPSVDFQRDMVVVAGLGVIGGLDGSFITVDSVRPRPCEPPTPSRVKAGPAVHHTCREFADVFIRIGIAGQGCIGTMIQVSPVVIVQVPKVSGIPVFQEQTHVRDCGWSG